MAVFARHRPPGRGRAPVEIPPGADLAALTKRSSKAPKLELELEWVHGFETEAVRGRNLHALATTGEIAFAAAAVVVLYRVETRSQRHYLGHQGRRVTSVAVVDRKGQVPLAASGERAARPRVLVWDPRTLETVYALGESFFKGGIASVFFVTPRALVGVDSSANHGLGYWRLDDLAAGAALVADRARGAANDDACRAHWGGSTESDVHVDAQVLRLKNPAAEAKADRSPKPPAVFDGCGLGSDSTFVTVGPNRHVKFWTAEQRLGGDTWALRFVPGRWDTVASSGSKTATTRRCAYLPKAETVITVCDDGSARAWRDSTNFHTFKVPNDLPVTALRPAPDDPGSAFLTGDASGAVRLWRLDDMSESGGFPTVVATLRDDRVGDHIQDHHGQQQQQKTPQGKKPARIRDLCVASADVLFVSTTKGVVFRLDSESPEFSPLFAAHFFARMRPGSSDGASTTSRSLVSSSTTAPKKTTTSSSKDDNLNKTFLESKASVASLAVVSGSRVVTAGGDGTVCLYDISSNRCDAVCWRRLPGPATCADSKRQLLAVGTETNGVACFDARGLRRVRDPLPTDGKTVDCVAVASTLLAAATRDGVVRVATLVDSSSSSSDPRRWCPEPSNWRHSWAPQHGRSRVAELDIEPRCVCLRLTTCDGQLLFYDVQQKRQCGDDWRGVGWPGLKSAVGFHAAGAHSKTRPALSTAHVDTTGDLLAVGDADGAVRVLRSPCVAASAPGLRGLAHGGCAVAAVRWLPDAKHLVSVGGGDRTLMLWRLVQPRSSSKARGGESGIANTSSDNTPTPTSSVLDGRARCPSSSPLVSPTVSTSTSDTRRNTQPTQRRRKPRLVCCYLCGALNPVPSLQRHIQACEKRWIHVHAAARRGDPLDPGPPPPNPCPDTDFAALAPDAFAQLNQDLEAYYRQHVLCGCQHCGRRFTRPALPKHQAACSASKPFQPPIGRRRSKPSDDQPRA